MIPFVDKAMIAVSGHFHLEVERRGRIVQVEDRPNQIVNSYKKILPLALGAESDGHLTMFAMGDGHHVGGPGQAGGPPYTPIAPSIDDVALEAQLYEKAIASRAFPLDRISVVFSLDINYNEGNIYLPETYYTEFGMFTPDIAWNGAIPLMYCIASTAGVMKDQNTIFHVSWTISFT